MNETSERERESERAGGGWGDEKMSPSSRWNVSHLHRHSPSCVSTVKNCSWCLKLAFLNFYHHLIHQFLSFSLCVVCARDEMRCRARCWEKREGKKIIFLQVERDSNENIQQNGELFTRQKSHKYYKIIISRFFLLCGPPPSFGLFSAAAALLLSERR